jgi:pyruvate carboxylase
MVVEVKVAPGQEVKKDDKLVVLEAMKMEMTLSSPLDGVVKEVLVRPKERVDSGDLVIVFQ